MSNPGFCVFEECVAPRLAGRSVCENCACEFMRGDYDFGTTEGEEDLYTSVFTRHDAEIKEAARFYPLPDEQGHRGCEERALCFIAGLVGQK